MSLLINYNAMMRKKGAAFNYAALPNVQYLMDFNSLFAADGASITQFTEQKSGMVLNQRRVNGSSQLFSAIVRHNAVNGRKALEFDGTQSFQFPTSFNSILNGKTGATFFQVVRYQASATTDSNAFFIAMPSSATTARFSAAHRTTATPFGPAIGGRRADADAYVGAAPGIILSADQYIIQAGKTDLTIGAAKTWINNIKYTNTNWQSSSSAVTSFPNTTPLHAAVGSNVVSGTTTTGMKGQIAFQMFVNAPMADADIESIIAQLSIDYNIPIPATVTRNGFLHSAFALGSAGNLVINGWTFQAKTNGYGFSWEQGTSPGDPTVSGDLNTLTKTWAREKNSFSSPIFLAGATAGQTYEMYFHAILQPSFNATVVIRPHQTATDEYSFALANTSSIDHKYVLLGPCRFTKPQSDSNGDILPMSNGLAGGNVRFCGLEVWRV